MTPKLKELIQGCEEVYGNFICEAPFGFRDPLDHGYGKLLVKEEVVKDLNDKFFRLLALVKLQTEFIEYLIDMETDGQTSPIVKHDVAIGAQDCLSKSEELAK